MLYFHVFDWPADGVLQIPGLLNNPVKANLLADTKRKPLALGRDEDALLITVPKTAPDSICSVVAVEIKGQLDLTEPPVFITEFDVFIDSLKVTLLTDRQNVQIRFTFDGKEPTDSSYLYVGPVIIQGTCIMSARCFRDGKPVSGTVQKKFKRVSAYAPKPVTNPLPGLFYKYYEGAFDSVANFKKSSPLKEGTAENFTFKPRNQEDNFAFTWSGYVNIPDNAVYEFYTESDDGSKLYIDDMQVVNNDGLHARESKSGVIALKKGFHKIRVEYFERTGSDELDVYVRSTKLAKQPLPKEWLFYQAIVK
jgi:alpha-L-fucosidase